MSGSGKGRSTGTGSTGGEPRAPRTSPAGGTSTAGRGTPGPRPKGAAVKRQPETSAATLIIEGRRHRQKIAAVVTAVAVVVAGGIVAGVLAAGSSPSATSTTSSSTSAPSTTTAPSTTRPSLPLAPLATLGPLESPGSPGPFGPEGVPVPHGPPLATIAKAATGQAVDGISCDTSEQLLFHIHAHLTIFVDGSPRQVPYGIGIPNPQVQQTPQGPFVASGSCFYWLHAHAADGIVHIESPIVRTYTLGNLFDEWGVALGPDQLGPYQGKVTALYDGQVYTGDPRDVPLDAHAQIQLMIGKPLVAPVQITFPSGL